MDEEAQAFIDAYKHSDGIMDWYRVLDVSRFATPEQIRHSFAVLSDTFGPKEGTRSKKDAVRYVLLKQGFIELDDPARRKKYDAFLRNEQDHARTLIAIKGERQKQSVAQPDIRPNAGIVRIFSNKVDSSLKRIALVAFPFLAAVTLFKLFHDVDHYGWSGSLFFVLFGMASILCLLIAFTHFGDWLAGRG